MDVLFGDYSNTLLALISWQYVFVRLNRKIPPDNRTRDYVTCIVLLNIFLRFGAILQMAPKRSVRVLRGQPRKTRRQATSGASVASNDATGPYGIGPDVDIGSTASTPESTIAETIAAAVIRQLEMSGRLLPAA